MATHDPRRLIEDLRGHLATHDRKLAFLFGAGTSCSINIAPVPPAGQRPEHIPLIPGIDGLTSACCSTVSELGDLQKEAWRKLVQQCDQSGVRPNIENVLSIVRVKIDAVGQGEKLAGLDQDQLRSIENTICATIAKKVNPDDESIPDKVPHDNFAAWVRRINRSVPLEIFTTNYDLLLERAFETARVPVFDGFVGSHQPYFYPECVEDDRLLPGSHWVRFWKLHGSVHWHVVGSGQSNRIIRSHVSETGEMILPSHRKYDESRKQPYLAYMDRLLRILSADHALLITCGYSFGDEHINAILYGALDNRNTTNIIALQYENMSVDDDVIRVAIQRSNLTVIAPNGGVVSGTWGEWQLSDPVDKRTCSFIDTAFDSNALPEEEGSPANVSVDLRGRMRVGDFNWFCQFLNAMVLGAE